MYLTDFAEPMLALHWRNNIKTIGGKSIKTIGGINVKNYVIK